MADKVNVSFVEDIPSISREGGTRGSKYDDLLDKVKEAGRVACLTFDTQGKATSRYQSIKGAADKREDASHWEVAQRSVNEKTFNVYVKWNAEAPEQEDKESKRKEALKKAHSNAKKKSTKKSTKKTAKKADAAF